jgi:hypothetical protein
VGPAAGPPWVQKVGRGDAVTIGGGLRHDVHLAGLNGEVHAMVPWMDWMNVQGLRNSATATFLGGSHEMPAGAPFMRPWIWSRAATPGFPDDRRRGGGSRGHGSVSAPAPPSAPPERSFLCRHCVHGLHGYERACTAAVEPCTALHGHIRARAGIIIRELGVRVPPCYSRRTPDVEGPQDVPSCGLLCCHAKRRCSWSRPELPGRALNRPRAGSWCPGRARIVRTSGGGRP